MQSIIIAFALCNLLVIFSHHPLSTTTTLLVLTTSFPHLYTNPCLCLMSTPGTCSWLFVSFEPFFVSNRCGDHLLEDSWLELWFQGKQSMKEKCEKRAVLDSLWKHLTSQRLKHKVARQLSRTTFMEAEIGRTTETKFRGSWTHDIRIMYMDSSNSMVSVRTCSVSMQPQNSHETRKLVRAYMCSFNHES